MTHEDPPASGLDERLMLELARIYMRAALADLMKEQGELHPDEEGGACK